MKSPSLWLAAGLSLAAAVSFIPVTAAAAVPAAEAARLKDDLTPVGAEKAGNKDGSIPAWSGGFAPKTGPAVGRRPDPFAAEKPLFSITAQNLAKHEDKLTAGTLAMLKKYPATFRLDVYPTHRTAGVTPAFAEATFKDATSTRLVIDANGRSRPEGTAGGIPFPIPKSGQEAMFNHVMAYWPPYRITGNNYLLQADGKRVLLSVYTNDVIRYYGGAERTKTGLYWAVRSLTTNPPLRAGEGIVGHYFEDGTKDTSWVYLPGQRRVRKLPTSCCDVPAPFAAGIISFDEIPGTFSGSMHKFDWTLLGKKEIYVPYNSNRALVPAKVDDVVGKSHLNPDHQRWELHRVWVVEAKLKPGERHTSVRSLYYLDEDSWQGLLADRYDAQGVLARTGFMQAVLMTETASLLPGVWGWYDLVSGAAYLSSVMNEASQQLQIFDTFPAATFSPDALAADGVR